MRILAVSDLYPPDFIGGYELCCRQAIDGLQARGHEVQVLTSAPRTPCASQPCVRRLLKLADCFGGARSSDGTPGAWERIEAEAHFVSAFNVHVLTTALEGFRPDVVYVWNLIGLGGLGLIGCLQHLRVPWVWYLGDDVPRTLCSRDGEVVPALAREFSRLVQGSYMPVSRRLVTEIEEGGIELRDQVDVTPNWIVGQKPLPRGRHYSPGERLRIVYAGQIGRHKGTDLLALAAVRLRARGFHNFSVDLYGTLHDPIFARRLGELGLSEHVRLKGQVSQSDLLSSYAAHQYDVFAFPTWPREPFGCAPLEAAAYGTVMAISQNCGIAEWFVHGVHCLKVERSAAAFAELLENILRGAIQLGPLALRAAAVIWRDFHLDAILTKIEQALARAMRRPRDGAGTADEAYRLALLAEKLNHALIAEEVS